MTGFELQISGVGSSRSTNCPQLCLVVVSVILKNCPSSCFSSICGKFVNEPCDRSLVRFKRNKKSCDAANNNRLKHFGRSQLVFERFGKRCHFPELDNSRAEKIKIKMDLQNLGFEDDSFENLQLEVS